MVKLLLFADDMVVLADTAEDLQNSLDRLYDYCNTWGLSVNTDKSKIVVFRKRGSVQNHKKRTYNTGSRKYC